MGLAILARKNKEINKVVLLPLSQIESNPNQPRRIFDEHALNELSVSINENGLLQPITVRKIMDNRYELIAGERRVMAYKKLGKEFIPSIVDDFDDNQSAIMALIENLQRRDLHFIEEAIAISNLIEYSGVRQQDISAKLGKAQSTIANKLRLLKCSIPVQYKMIESNISERHARALLALEGDELILDTIDHILRENLNVEQTEAYIKDITNKRITNVKPRKYYIKNMRIFLNTIDKAISMMNVSGISAKSMKRETDSDIEYIISIPKSCIYK